MSIKPLIRSLYESPMTGDEIEAKSFETIDAEAQVSGFSPGQWAVVRRLVHASADFNLVDQIRFSENAIDAGMRALRSGSKIYVDSKMILSGLSLPRLRRVSLDYSPERLMCHVSDPDVVTMSKETGLPRSLHAVRKSAPKLELMSLGVEFIAIEGRRGGSPLAVATVHALCELAVLPA